MRSVTYTNSNGQSLTLGVSPHIIESIEGIAGAPVDIQTQKAPYQDGETDIDAILQKREIIIQGAFAATTLSAIFSARNSMIGILSPKAGPGTLKVTTDAGTIVCTAIPREPVIANKAATDAFQRFQLTFVASDPYFYDLNQTSLQVNVTSPSATFPIQFPVTLSSRPNFTNSVFVSNVGHVTSPVQIVFTGPAVNPKITNITTGEYIRFTKTLAAGDTLTINTEFGKKSVIFKPFGGANQNGMAYLDLNSKFWSLAIGGNTIVFSDDSNSASASIVLTYKNRFLGA